MAKLILLETLFLSKSLQLAIGEDQTGNTLCHRAVHLHLTTNGEGFFRKAKVLIAINVTKATRLSMSMKLKTHIQDNDKIWLLTDIEWERHKKFLEVRISAR